MNASIAPSRSPARRRGANPFSSSLMRGGEFRRYWCAALLQDCASWLLFAAQGWLLIQLTDRAAAIALFFLLRMGPKVLVALPAGALTDRRGPLHVLRWARFAGTLPALLLSAVLLLDRLTLNTLLLSAALASIIQAFEQPASRSLLPRYAPGRRLVGGVALIATAGTLATVAAPLLLSLIVLLGGVSWVFPVQALLLLASGAILLRNRTGGAPAERRPGRTGSDCWAALRVLASTPAIIALILLAGSPGLLDRLLAVITPGYADQLGGHWTMAVLFLAPAGGALLGGSALAWAGEEMRRLLPLALGSSGVAALSIGLLAVTELFIVALLLFIILGAAKATFAVAVMAALQRRVPEHARGRMLAL